jgi:NADH-quinone oxidoreductase subunit J
MLLEWILFIGLSIVAIGGAIGLLVSRNAIYAALNLIINFTAVAIFYAVLAAPFIAMAQVAVYAGAIMVLFLFVIMLLGAEQLSAENNLPWQRPLAYVFGGILAVEAVVAFILRGRGAQVAASVVSEGFGSPAAVGETMFGAYLLPFEVISLLLLAAMVGAIVLARSHRRPTQKN